MILITKDCNLFKTDCQICDVKHTLYCNKSSNGKCVCKESFGKNDCRKLITTKTCRNNGKVVYNETKDKVLCECQPCFTGDQCELPDKFPHCSAAQIIGETAHALGCSYVVIILSVTVGFELLFDRSQPFGFLKINSNAALLSAHVLILLFHVPFAYSLPKLFCSFVAAAVSYFHTVFFTFSAIIAFNSFCYMTGCVISGVPFGIPIIYMLLFGWAFPLLYTAIVASMQFTDLSTTWTCIQNLDNWNVPGSLLGCLTICIILIYVLSEAAGQDEYWIIGFLKIVDKRNLLSTKIMR